MSQLSRLYLCCYNSLQALGCIVISICMAFAIYRILSSFFASKSVKGAYAASGELICFLQSVAFLEVIHGALGLVPSGVLIPFTQWGGRTHFLLAIVRRIDEVQEEPAVFLTFFSWSLSEIIRYPKYAFQCIGRSPSWLTYLRYTAFILLYPTGGVFGEIWLMYQALPFIKEKKLYADVFSSLPFSYDQFVKVLLLAYPFLLLKLYLHMFKQRLSKLSNKHKERKRR